MPMLTSTTTVAVATVAVVAMVTIVSAKRRRRWPVKLSKDNIQHFMNQIDAVVSDCDGVIWILGRGGVPNAREGIESLKAAGKKVMFATNNSVLGPIEKFKRFGYDVTSEDVVHPSKALTSYLRKINFQKKVFVLASGRFKDEMRRGGIRVLPDTRTGGLVEDLTLEDIVGHIDPDPEVGAVVVDLDINLTYRDLNVAVNHLLQPGCRLFAGATDQAVTCPDGKVIIGPAPFLQMAEQISGKKAEVIGKPGPMMITNFLKDEHSLNLKRTVFVGDTLAQDMGVANACGMIKLLVLTGMTKPRDLDTCPAELMPDYVIDSIGDFVQLLKL